MSGTGKETLGRALLDVATGLETLKVTTCVGAIQAKKKSSGAGATGFELVWKPEDVKVMATEIRLVDGDANNFLHDDFTGDTEMRQYHERQVARAQEVVQRNVDMMIKIAGKLVDELKDLIS